MIDFFSRLDNYMNYRRLNDNKLTVDCHLANGIIGKARKRGALSQDNISKILNRYTELNANWLFTGEGEMLRGQDLAENNEYGSGLPSGPCAQCELREKVIANQEKTIQLLEDKIEGMKKVYSTEKDGQNEGYKKTG